ncbi:MAG: HD domain-containing protein [Chitinophagaceae bacterium]|nr:HD domain-containing protein [Chitinophagaceae bacterium]
MQKIINDPVHGFITIDDKLIYDLLAHPYFQRLRRIKQMALAYLVYPGAVHTRLHHALGAYHLMYKVLIELRLKGISITAEEEQAVKIAILLHDIGHAPFSHALEHSLVSVHHEEISLLIMQKLNEEFDGQLQRAIEIFKGTYSKKFLHQLVSSQLDMDRLDYLARDSFFTGVSEGVIGYDRIIKMITVLNDELVVEEKGIHSVENFLIARRLMYWQVYFHKTVMSSEMMLVQILKRAKELIHQGVSLFSTPSLSFFLKEEKQSADFSSDPRCLEYYTQLDDTDISTAIKYWATCDDQILKTLCTNLIQRKLFKLKFVSLEEGKPLFKNWLDRVQPNKEQENYFWLEGDVLHTGYDNKGGKINILFKNGSLKEISALEHGLISAELQVPVKKHYICHLN